MMENKELKKVVSKKRRRRRWSGQGGNEVVERKPEMEDG